jgi:phosphate transport system substrate-binding protein
MRTLIALTTAGVLALGVSACGSSSNSKSSGSTDTSGSGSTSTSASITPASISGAGSTLAAPVYMQWGSDLKSQGVTLEYNPSGSGAGVAALQAGTVGFAASDPALSSDDRAGLKKGAAVQIPTVLGAITVSYNLSGVKSGLKLDGPTIADIYLGKVKTWNDPEIAKLNPNVSLPSTAITVVHRSDSSGTTKGFTTFLSDYSSQWKRKVGADKTVNWPTGTGAEKNSGVAAAVKQKSGSIGYVEQAYALQNGFTYAAVKNSNGKFVPPTLATTSAAGTGVTIPTDLGYTAINSPNAAAYPIVSQTFVIAYVDSCKAGTMSANEAAAFGVFMKYGLGPGQDAAKQLSYAPLPPKLLASAKLAAKTLVCNGKSIGA